MAARISEGKGSGVRMSVFSLGGSLGWAVGPLVAVGMVGWLGLERLWIAMFPGILVAALIYPFLPPSRRDRGGQAPSFAPKVLQRLRGPLGLLFGISMMGAFAQRVFLTMAPIIGAERGASETSGALALSLYLGTQALGTLAGGFLADRMDRGRLLAGLTLFRVSSPFSCGLPGSRRTAGIFGGLRRRVLRHGHDAGDRGQGSGDSPRQRCGGFRDRHGPRLGGRVHLRSGNWSPRRLDRTPGGGYGVHAGPLDWNRPCPSSSLEGEGPGWRAAVIVRSTWGILCRFEYPRHAAEGRAPEGPEALPADQESGCHRTEAGRCALSPR